MGDWPRMRVGAGLGGDRRVTNGYHEPVSHRKRAAGAGTTAVPLSETRRLLPGCNASGRLPVLPADGPEGAYAGVAVAGARAGEVVPFREA
jgi:hypothetical protein